MHQTDPQAAEELLQRRDRLSPRHLSRGAMHQIDLQAAEELLQRCDHFSPGLQSRGAVHQIDLRQPKSCCRGGTALAPAFRAGVRCTR